MSERAKEPKPAGGTDRAQRPDVDQRATADLDPAVENAEKVKGGIPKQPTGNGGDYCC